MEIHEEELLATGVEGVDSPEVDDLSLDSHFAQKTAKHLTQNGSGQYSDATVLRPAQDRASIEGEAGRLPPAIDTDQEPTVFKPASVQNGNVDDTAFDSPSPAAAAPQALTSLVDEGLIDKRYELQELLGEGGMGKVYKAIDRESNGDVFALKILSEDFKSHPDAVISLERECAKARRLRHDNIVGVHHFARDRDTGEVYMLLEYLQGMPLNALLKTHYGQGLPKAQAMQILGGLCRGLQYAHACLLVHSDLKPGNVFVTEDNITKILDFGLARALSDENNVFDPSSLKALTPAYASIEIQQGELPAFSDDIYALGCVAYELFAGRHPFNRLSAQEAQAKNIKAARIKSLSRRQWRILKSALSFTAEKRVASVEMFAKHFFERSKLTLVLAVGVVFLIPFGLWFLSEQKAEEVEQKAIELEHQNTVLQVQQRQERTTFEQQQVAMEQKMTAERAAVVKEKLSELIASPSSSESWAYSIQKSLNEYRELLPDDTAFELHAKQRISLSFIALAKSTVTASRASQKNIAATKYLIKNAESWAADVQLLANEDLAASEEFLQNKQMIEQQVVEVKRLIRAKQQELDSERNVAMQANIAQQIERLERSVFCSKRLDVKGAVSENLRGLKRLSQKDEARQRPIVAKRLAACILVSANTSLARANQLKQEALRLLPEQESLRHLKIDRCANLAPGSGARKSKFCRDILSVGGKGPSLVVVPVGGDKRLAISKYEITGNNIKIYCDAVGGCKRQGAASGWIPAHNIGFVQIKNYINWLSRQTGYRYRLPTHKEWLLAASVSTEESEAARNCHTKYGLMKGDVLNDANSGAANQYGLFNMVGNVRELVYNAAGQLLAVGGSRKTAINKCSAKTRMTHSGKADLLTGFRVVRDVGV